MGKVLVVRSTALRGLEDSLRARLAAWFRDSRGLLLSFILGSFFAALCSEGNQPAAADPSKIEITLERSSCFGTCPAYEVTIHGDGRVVFTTETGPSDPESAFHGEFSAIYQRVVLPGTHEDLIAPGKVAALFERFREARFFDLRSSYWAAVTDNPTYVLTVNTGQRRKSVEDYVGDWVGMPKVVTDLEDAVDEVAGTDRWLTGTGLVAWLERQQFDFNSPEAAQLAASGAARKGDEAMVLALIDRGAPLDSEISNPKFPRTQAPEGSEFAKFLAESPEYKKPVVAGFSLMESAIEHRQVKLFNKLAADGWVDRVGKEKAAQLFAGHAAGCSPAIVDAAADAGIDIDQPETPRGRTALANLGTSYLCGNREADRVATAERLLARGANPNRRDGLGHTALYGVYKPDMTNLLLAHGAERR